MTMKKRLMSCVLACAAIVGVTSLANAQVQSGVVGSGIHQQFGPQDDNGNYLGMSSDSYDWYVDPGFSYTYPGATSPPLIKTRPQTVRKPLKGDIS